MKINKGDCRALADRIAEQLLTEYLIKGDVGGQYLMVPQEHCPRRMDFTEVIAKQVEEFFA